MATMQFIAEIQEVINRHSVDNKLNIPDDILADFIVNMIDCLEEMFTDTQCRSDD